MFSYWDDLDAEVSALFHEATARARQCLWVFACWDDLDADFRVFYHIDLSGDDFRDLSSSRFFALAERTIYYEGSVLKGMMRRHAKLQEQEQAEASSTVPVGLAHMFD